MEWRAREARRKPGFGFTTSSFTTSSCIAREIPLSTAIRIAGWKESRFENIKFFISSNPASPYDTAKNAMSFRLDQGISGCRNIEVNWEKPWFDKWESALSLQDIDRLQVDGFSGSSAFPERNIPAMVLDRVKGASLRNMEALPGTDLFLKIAGANTQDIHFFGNNFHEAKTPYQLDPDVKPDSVTALDNFMPVKSD